jgi:hypothetical protein
MAGLKLMTADDREREREERRTRFVGATYGSVLDVSSAVLAEFEAALADGGEEVIQRCLTQHPYIIQYALRHSGHHGTWAFPKQVIRTTAADRSKGMIPDYLVAAASSLGYRWFIVELKRPSIQFANSRGDAFSSEANKAVAQCQSYLAHFQNYIDSVRANVRIGDLIQPQGAVLIMGRSSSETEAHRQFRANFVETTPKIDVVSYDRLLEGLRADVAARERQSTGT